VSRGRKTASQGTKSTIKAAIFGDLPLKNTLPNQPTSLQPANQAPAQNFPKTGHLRSLQNRLLWVAEDVIVLPCDGADLQGAV
jgi:hypothetical protein